MLFLVSLAAGKFWTVERGGQGRRMLSTGGCSALLAIVFWGVLSGSRYVDAADMTADTRL